MTESTAKAGSKLSDSRLAGSVAAALFCRIMLNTARRFAYPFAPVLSRGLDVPLTAVTSLIAVNQATGVLGIFFGPIADRWGYRRIMLVAMAMLSIGMLVSGIWPFYALVMFGLFMSGLAKNVFDPAVQAFAGERIAFRHRGRVIGILEFSWAGSTLLGIPLVGLLLNGYGWRSPFFVLGAAGILGGGLLVWLMPATAGAQAAESSRDGIRRAWRRLVRHRRAVAAMAFGFFISAANDNLFVIYGAWLETSFQVSVVALGLGTGLIGIAELCGEILTAALADRCGLKRSVIAGLILTMLSYLILPAARWNLGLALAGLVGVFIVFEFTMVAFLSLCTELVPERRATMMSMMLAAAGIGRVVGALIGGPIWMAGGITATASASALISAMALAALLWGLKGWTPS
jgi:predicted MFS family arabinose efflux permease